MEIVFYVAAFVAVFSTMKVVTNVVPVHALLYLIVSLLSVAVIFFTLGAPFAGILEVIVYAGAIIVLFVFVVMMLNLGTQVSAQEKAWLVPRLWIGPTLLTALLMSALVGGLRQHAGAMGHTLVDARQVGISLFGPYLLLVELGSLLLLGALVAAYHLGKRESGTGDERERTLK